MSKKGRTVSRQILYMVAMVAIQKNPLIREIYLKHTEKGMVKKAALGLCMHKICRIIYGMLKHDQVFDPKVDRNNQVRSIKGKTKVRKDKTRRYQNFDAKASISGRQTKKRKEQKQSQSDNNAINEILKISIPVSV